MLQRVHYRFARRSNRAPGHQPEVLCIGNFKTGTVSLAGLLGQRLRGRHEPHAYLFSRMWLKKESGQLPETAWKDFLIRRSNALALDFESSGFLTVEAPLLVRLFPRTKFVLTIRDPESWCRSMYRHIEKNRALLGCHYWEPVLARYFSGKNFTAEEAEVRDRGLYPLAGLLAYWERSNRSVIESIPRERLLVLETKKLTESISQLEGFMGWERGSLDSRKSHLHASQKTADSISPVMATHVERLSSPYLSDYHQWTSR